MNTTAIILAALVVGLAIFMCIKITRPYWTRKHKKQETLLGVVHPKDDDTGA